MNSQTLVAAKSWPGLGRCPVALVTFVAALALLVATPVHADRVNVLLVTLDTTRADRLGAYGYAAANTPAFDALAESGTLFENAYSPCPLTLPAHATMFSGLQPPEHGLRINGAASLPEDVTTLAERLSADGYRTGAFVAAFVLSDKFGLAQGFDTYDDDLAGALEQDVEEELSRYRPGNLVVDSAIEWLGEGDETGEPFFAWVHFYDAHYPYHPHPGEEGEAPAPSYDSEIAFADRQLGRLLRFLETRDLTDDTLVVVAGDHGEGLNDHGDFEHGHLVNEEVLRVPLVVSLPGRVRAGQRVASIVSLRDLAPTVLAVATPGSAGLGGGRSLVPALEGESIPSQPSYGEAEMPWTAFGWSPLRSVTTDAWKYVRSARPELYHRAEDRGELFNLATVRTETAAELDAVLTGLEEAMNVGQAAPVVGLTAEETERLEALGYIAADTTASTERGLVGLRDIKDMLATKHLETDLTRGLAFGVLDQDQVLDIARRLVAQSPETARFQARLGALLLDAGDPTAAEEPLREALRLDPRHVDAAANLAISLGLRSHHVEAREHLALALSIDPESSAVHLVVGRAHRALGQVDAALGHFAEARRLDPGSAAASLAMGLALESIGRHGRAADAFVAAIEVAPNQAHGHYELARMLVLLGRNDNALSHYRRVLQLEPDHNDARNNLGVLLADLGRSDEAVAEYRETLRRNPAFARAHFNLGLELGRRGDTAGAIAALERALALQPGWSQAHERLAWQLTNADAVALRDPARAVELATRAVELTGGRDARATLTLAVAQAADGNFDLAAATAARAAATAAANDNRAMVAEIEESRPLYERP